MGKAVIAIHGGAGAISRAQMTPEREREYVAALSAIVESGQKMLAAGASALDAVTEAVRLLEECPLFNAGIGSVFTHDQTHELDACVMDGYSLQAGAVLDCLRLAGRSCNRFFNVGRLAVCDAVGLVADILINFNDHYFK